MRVGIVAPDLRQPGGVREKALFVARSLTRHLGASVRLVSLATSRFDATSILLGQPRTWRRSIVSSYIVEEFTVDHVGTVGAEIEVARYARRHVILKLLERCDVVHAVCGTPAWAHAVSGFAGPVVVHFASFVRHERCHETTGRRSALDRWRRLMTAAVGLAERAALRRADIIIPVNATRGLEVRVLVNAETPVEVVHTGVDTDCFAPGPYYREDGYLLTVGRLNDPRKNVPLLLRAYASARGRSSSVPGLVLAGVAAPDRESDDLIGQLGVTGSVQYVGPQDRRALADLYRGASAFVLSSNEEGQGIVVVEAMSSGLPIVATSCIGPSELVTNGVEGVLTPVGSVDGLADAIVTLSQDPQRRHEMAQASRSRAVREFSLERAGARLASVYRAHGILDGVVRGSTHEALGQA
jgi:glycosyltransferase involved in cell wall biosynthesis